MSTNMWFKGDIRNVLLGVRVASSLTASGTGLMSESERCAYEKGFLAALVSVAVGFGIPTADLGIPIEVASNGSMRIGNGRSQRP